MCWEHDLLYVTVSSASSPVFHLTRSRAHNKAQEKAIEVLNEQREPFIIDMERLVLLLDNTVLLTQDYVVPRLEKLYSLFAQCIYEHRMEFNKTEMIAVSSFTHLYVHKLVECLLFWWWIYYGDAMNNTTVLIESVISTTNIKIVF